MSEKTIESPAQLQPTATENVAVFGTCDQVVHPGLAAPVTPLIVEESFVLGRVPVCRRTLKTWRDNGTIPYIKIGARVMYRWPSVEAALVRLQRCTR